MPHSNATAFTGHKRKSLRSCKLHPGVSAQASSPSMHGAGHAVCIFGLGYTTIALANMLSHRGWCVLHEGAQRLHVQAWHEEHHAH